MFIKYKYNIKQKIKHILKEKIKYEDEGEKCEFCGGSFILKEPSKTKKEDLYVNCPICEESMTSIEKEVDTEHEAFISNIYIKSILKEDGEAENTIFYGITGYSFDKEYILKEEDIIEAEGVIKANEIKDGYKVGDKVNTYRGVYYHDEIECSECNGSGNLSITRNNKTTDAKCPCCNGHGVEYCAVVDDRSVCTITEIEYKQNAHTFNAQYFIKNDENGYGFWIDRRDISHSKQKENAVVVEV